MADTILPNFFVDEDGDSCEQYGETSMGMASTGGVASSDDIFSILEALQGHFSPSLTTDSPLDDDNIFALSKESQDQPSSCTTTIPTTTATTIFVSQKFSTTSSSAAALQGYETDQTTEADLELEMEPEEVPSSSPKSKRQKVNNSANNNHSDQEAAAAGANSDGQQKNVSHINVERNRRKQMNEHLTVLRGLMPCFYVKRGDQASIIGGVVDYISELQQVLQSLEAKKQRKVYSDIVLSPRVVSSPRPSPLSPRKPPLSPRPNLPISPRTPQSSTSPYKPRLLQQVQASTNNSAGYNLQSPTTSTSAPSLDPSPCSSSTTSSINDSLKELVVNSKSAIADVEVKFSGPNLLVKTLSPRIPGQAMKIISTLEELSLEILHADISAIDDTTMVFSFTIKIGIECQLSADELAQQIQQTFC